MKIYNLQDRLLVFSRRIVSICKMIPRSPDGDVIRKQLVAAGTSVGANYEEAEGAETKKDYVHSLVICRKEAKETRYWLRLIAGSILDLEEIQSDIDEAYEIMKILNSMIVKSRDKKK